MRSFYYSLTNIFQIFEWWYFRKYGTSFIEQVSLNHISPWFGGEAGSENNNSNSQQTVSGGFCKEEVVLIIKISFKITNNLQLKKKPKLLQNVKYGGIL